VTSPVINKLQTVEAFVVVDLPGAETADGLVRCAPKVLHDSTKALARSRTYSWALLGQPMSGASAGINATADTRTTAVERFCTEIAPEVAAGHLVLSAGKGVSDDELADLGTAQAANPEAFVQGVLACAAAARNHSLGSSAGLDSATVAIESDGGSGEVLRSALQARGAEVVSEGPDALDAQADVLLFGSRPGVIDHDLAATLRHRVLVPTGALAFTAKALAVAQQREILVLPDFLTTAGPLAARAGSDPDEALAERTEAALDHDAGAVLGACLIAEEFLGSWCEALPFGRPIG
jgi:glutamate dehydrogenase/leucine dehydrogenase